MDRRAAEQAFVGIVSIIICVLSDTEIMKAAFMVVGTMYFISSWNNLE